MPQDQEALAQAATPAFVLVDDEPLHRERWRRAAVRLVCAQFPPHTRCLWHQHVKYSVYIVVAPLLVTEQSLGNAPVQLTKQRGEVFCRDHTIDRLVHVDATAELPAFIVLVELIKAKAAARPHDDLPPHSGAGVELLNDARECRVYRLTLSLRLDGEDNATAETAMSLPTESVLVAVDACTVKLATANSGAAGAASSQTRSLHVGDDVVLQAGDVLMGLPACSSS